MNSEKEILLEVKKHLRAFAQNKQYGKITVRIKRGEPLFVGYEVQKKVGSEINQPVNTSTPTPPAPSQEGELWIASHWLAMTVVQPPLTPSGRGGGLIGEKNGTKCKSNT